MRPGNLFGDIPPPAEPIRPLLAVEKVRGGSG